MAQNFKKLSMSKEKGFHYYTWYPKDWQTSDSVFTLTLEQRAIYRELIDLAYLENNAIEPSERVWARRWNADLSVVVKILSELCDLGLIEKNNGKYKVPSCDSRLKLKNKGREGGKIKGSVKGNAKGILKGSNKGKANQTEQTEQTESIVEPSLLDFVIFFEEKGYTKEHAETAYQHYKDRGWVDQAGNDVLKTWKSSCLKYWLKDEQGKKKLSEGEMLIKMIGEGN